MSHSSCHGNDSYQNKTDNRSLPSYDALSVDNEGVDVNSGNVDEKRNLTIKGRSIIKVGAVLIACLLIAGSGRRLFGFFSSRRGAVDDQGGNSSSSEEPKNDKVNVHEVNVHDIIWSDEFDGDSLDLSRWTHANGDGCDVGLCGWGNNELEWYTEKNTFLTDGKLVIEAREQDIGDATYSSSKISSKGKADFGPIGSRFEARIKLPWGRGIWPAFWMLPTDNVYGGWPKSGEIDIMENIGKEGTNTVHGTVHYGLDWPQYQYSEAGLTMPPENAGKFNETFHTYAVEREPNRIRWFLDDVEYSTVTRESMLPYTWPFDERFYFIINLAVGGYWPGYPDGNTTFPQRMEVDYVRVYGGLFPRIEGRTLVNQSESNVVFDVVNVDSVSYNYTWEVPKGSKITSGQGSERINVTFGRNSGIVRVKADGVDHESIQESEGLSKLCNGLGLRVKAVDVSALKSFGFNCGRPLTCNPTVLSRVADVYTCGERIQWLMEEKNESEEDACRKIGYEQFHGPCGACNPLIR